MSSSMKFGIILAVGLLSTYIGWNTYNYFFSISTPEVNVVGMEEGGAYTGEYKASIQGKDAYKVGRLTVKVDGKPFIDNVKISKKNFDYPFILPTKDLQEGEHLLEVEITNSAYNKRHAKTELHFKVDNQPLRAAFVKNESDAKIWQGRTLHLQFQTNKEIKEAHVKTLSKSYPCFRESDRTFTYECFVPIDVEEDPRENPLTLEIKDYVGNRLTLQGKFQVVAFPFKKQSIKIDAQKYKAEQEAGASEKQFEIDAEALTKKSPQKKLWLGLFITPLEMKDPKQITTEYGVIRATQERGLMRHKAIDLYAMPKSVVWAPQDGIVVMKARYAHSGNTVAIDHGWGIISYFFHLDTFAPVEIGEKIKKGNPVGTLGKTGYATGYHLHWEMRVGNVAIDPMEWTKPNF